VTRHAWLTRYARRRRLVAAALAAASVISAYLATRPAASGAPTVLVASRDLAPGPIRMGDFHRVALDPPPAGAIGEVTPGQTLATPMRRGEPLTDVRLLASYHLPQGLVATPVRLADAATASLISPGSTVDLLASSQEGVPARHITSGTTVITVPPVRERDAHSGALIVLATTPTQAAELAAAQAHGRLSITIRPG
jgi:Flp pilus assembly protein CpaB